MSNYHDHFLLCSVSTEIKTTRLDRIQKKFYQLATLTDLTNSILYEVDIFYNGISNAFTINNQLQPILDQEKICKTHFIRGRLSMSFTKIMNQFYKTSSAKTNDFTGNGWTKTIFLFHARDSRDGMDLLIRFNL